MSESRKPGGTANIHEGKMRSKSHSWTEVITSTNDKHEYNITKKTSRRRRLHHQHRNMQGDDVDDTPSSLYSRRPRRFNLLSLLPLTTNPKTDINGQRTPIPFRIEIEMSAWLAWYYNSNQHNNTRTNILPHLQERFDACSRYNHQPMDFRFSMRDSKFSPLNAAAEFFHAYNSNNNNNNNNNAVSFVNDTNIYPEGSLLDDLQEILNVSTRPHAVIGSARSTVSSAVSYMTSAFMVPQISSSSTAAYLDNKDIHRFFARTITTNTGDAAAMALYLHFLNVTHVSILYINDEYGNDFHSDLLRELQSFNINTISQPYNDVSTEQSVKYLAASQIRYIIALLNPSSWTSVIRLADQYEIIGRPEYFWIFGESSLQFISSSFQIDRVSDGALARALHGSAVISVMEQPYEPFDIELLNFSQDELRRSMYINEHEEPEIFNNFTFSIPSRTVYQYFTYDAVTAMMLAACETPITDDEDYSSVSGLRIYEQLMRTEFQGVSGPVAFQPTTGTRKSEGLKYGVRNIQFPDHLTTDKFYKVSAGLAHIVSIMTNTTSLPALSSSSPPVDTVSPFFFASNTTTPPLSLPPLDHDLNLITPAVRIFGLLLSGAVMFVSLFWISWTLMHRTKDVVKASQPIFLCQICIGTFIIASAVIPMGMQEPTSRHGLDVACMATPWLISVGFVTTFSALFTKTWRLNRLFHSSRNFRRVVIRPKDVVLPFVILMIVNCSIMLAWTLHAPLIWERQQIANYDKYGRHVESVGWCVPSNTQNTTAIYLVLVVAINISVLVFANYQAYIARNIPSEFSESTYIAVAMGSLLEIFIIGIPLLFMSSSDPSISYLIRSILATVTSLSALFPIFLPKYIRRNINKRYHDAVVTATGFAPRSEGSVHMGFNSRTLSIAVDSEAKDDLDALGCGRGVSKIERNHDYFKEMETSFAKKTSRASFTTSSGRPTVQFVDNISNIPSCERSIRRYSMPVTPTEVGRQAFVEKF